MTGKCKKCGGAVKMEDTFCMHCGMPLEKEATVSSEFVAMNSAKAENSTKKEETCMEKTEDKERAKVLSMGDYLLMLILLSIPVVNFILCIVWIVSKSSNPNRRNFAKAWLVIAVVGHILSGILAYGAFQFLVMDNYVDINQHIEYSTPQEQFIEEFLTELDEV